MYSMEHLGAQYSLGTHVPLFYVGGGALFTKGDNLHLVIIVWVGVMVGETSHYHNGIV